MHAELEKLRNGQEMGLAFYREVPYCLAEGPTIEAARSELKYIIIPFLSGILKDGGSLPVPMAGGSKH